MMPRIRATNATIAKPFAVRVALALLIIVLVASTRSGGARAATEGPWVAVSDIHYDPGDYASHPSNYGEDTDGVLFDSFVRALHAADPDPPVVIIGGDFLAHHMDRALDSATMVMLARRFNALYPRAQFLITLGNNDSPCGDYAAPVDDAFLAATARAWAPLVNRNGAAPDFARTFAHDGSYVARLPLPGLRAVVINDVSFSLRLATRCAPAGDDPASMALDDLQAAFARAPPDSQVWLLLHVPPGIDAYSTSHLAHHLAIVPFMRPHAREALDGAIEDPRHHVTLVIAGHTHKFAYRIAEGGARVPLLLVPSVSPIFSNAPSFLILDVGPHATIDRITEHSFDGAGWHTIGSLGELGLARFMTSDLLALQAHLARDAGARSTFSRLYSGGGPAEITPSNWQTYWCAATAFAAGAFQRCESQHGFSIFTQRALTLAAIAAAALVVVGGVLLGIRMRRQGRRAA